MKKNNRMVVAVLVVILVVAGIVWYGKKNSGDSVQGQWKTYNNEQYGFTFKYPSNLTLIDAPYKFGNDMGVSVVNEKREAAMSVYAGDFQSPMWVRKGESMGKYDPQTNKWLRARVNGFAPIYNSVDCPQSLSSRNSLPVISNSDGDMGIVESRRFLITNKNKVITIVTGVSEFSTISKDIQDDIVNSFALMSGTEAVKPVCN